MNTKKLPIVFSTVESSLILQVTGILTAAFSLLSISTIYNKESNLPSKNICIFAFWGESVVRKKIGRSRPLGLGHYFIFNCVWGNYL